MYFHIQTICFGVLVHNSRHITRKISKAALFFEDQYWCKYDLDMKRMIIKTVFDVTISEGQQLQKLTVFCSQTCSSEQVTELLTVLHLIKNEWHHAETRAGRIALTQSARTLAAICAKNSAREQTVQGPNEILLHLSCFWRALIKPVSP